MTTISRTAPSMMPAAMPASPDDLEAQLQALEDQYDGQDSTKSAEKLLQELGFTNQRPEKQYTKNTQQAVESFQRAVGLHPTGALDTKTMNAMRRAARAKHRGVEAPGQKSAGIATNERRLERQGYATRTDGVYDQGTAKAAASFNHDEAIAPKSKVARGLMGKLAQTALAGASHDTKSMQQELKEMHFQPGNVDGEYTNKTQAAVDAFRRKHHMSGVGQHATAGTLRAIRQAAANTGSAKQAQSEMKNLLRVAQESAGGQRPQGYCLKAVQDDLDRVKYGTGKVPRLPYAHDFADFLNRDGNAAKLGLKRLPIHNPYDAPPGAIVVVRAGTPGTANPVAGDIVVRGHGSHLYNDGEMSYGGPGNFPKGNSYVLGVYVPAGYRAHRRR
jgi:peptidoglycan hydrolase-like protein with peptidoglycan-binding domain